MLLATLFGAVHRYLRYRVQLLSMETLDDRLLNDIGLCRADLSTAVWHYVEHATGH